MSRSFVLITLAVVTLVASPLAAALHAPALHEPNNAIVKHVFPTIQKRFAGSGNQASPNMQYHEGAVHHQPRVYLVFWNWLGPGNIATDPSGEAQILQDFFGGVGGSAWANVQTQYADRGSTLGNPSNQLAGVWFDDDLVNGFPAQPDLFIGNEAQRAAAHFGYDADGNYMIMTPHLHNDAQFGAVYCAWHSWEDDGAGHPIAFSDIPYMTDGPEGCPGNFVNAGSTTDAITIVAGHEYAETVTDPHGDGWFDTNGAGENGDKCAWDAGPGANSQDIVLPTGTFPVQALWSNVDAACAVSYSGVAGAALDPNSGGGIHTPPPPIVYHESGSVNVMTVQPVVVGLNTQWNDLGQGTSVWRLDDASIRTLGEQRFTLKSTSGVDAAQDFDIYFYDAANNIIGSSAVAGNEAGTIPVGVDHAMVMLSSGTPGTFDFDTG